MPVPTSSTSPNESPDALPGRPLEQQRIHRCTHVGNLADAQWPYAQPVQQRPGPGLTAVQDGGQPLPVADDDRVVLGNVRQDRLDQGAAVIVDGRSVVDFVLVRRASKDAGVAEQFQVPGYAGLAEAGNLDDFSHRQLPVAQPPKQAQARRVLQRLKQVRQRMKVPHSTISI